MSAQAKEILAKLVGFDTTSCKTNRACIDYVRAYLEEFGVESEIILDSTGQKACLWATVGDASKNGVMLAGHTDVVPVDGQKWTSDPFALVEREGKLFGRGTVDMKGFIACALAIVPAFLSARTGGCFHLALTSDEESDMSGAIRLTEALLTKGRRPEWVWLGEPTGFSIVNQHKGCAAYLSRFSGVPGHSSLPDKGVNAIDMARRYMNAIDAVAVARRAKPFTSSFEVPYTTLNFGTIQGGTAENIIAETCELLWQVRPHPGDSAAAVLGDVVALASSGLEEVMAPFLDRARVETRERFDFPPFSGEGENKATEVLKSFLKASSFHAVGFATEAGLFQKLGADVAICGPGFMAQAHQPDEYIDKNQLLSCVDLMRQVLLSSSAHDL